jgi:hypothetical protein
MGSNAQRDSIPKMWFTNLEQTVMELHKPGMPPHD